MSKQNSAKNFPLLNQGEVARSDGEVDFGKWEGRKAGQNGQNENYKILKS